MLKRQSLLLTLSLLLLITLGWIGLGLISNRQATPLITLSTSSDAAPLLPTSGSDVPATATAMSVALPNVDDGSARPFIPASGEHWAEVSLSKALVTLYQGERVRQVFEMSYGRGDTPNTTTYPGLFTVYAKDASLHQSSVKGEYIRNWVGFDQRWANGFHSVIMDRSGAVIDQRLGQAVSSGCIRTSLANSALIFDWLPYGAQVWVHD